MSLPAFLRRQNSVPSLRATSARWICAGLSLSSLVLALRTQAAPIKAPFRVGSPQLRGWLAECGYSPAAISLVEKPARGELIFIDGGVAGRDAFWHAAPGGATLVGIPAGVDPWQHMAETAAQFQDLRAIHIISHGEAGTLMLNGRHFTAADLEAHSVALRALGRALSKNGDILLYGCETGRGVAGERFVATLADLTGADIAASANRTGGRTGADWNLEITRGEIEAAVAAPLDYAHDLATITVTSNADSGAGTLRQAIIDAINGDVITFNAAMTISLSTASGGSLLTINENLRIDGDLNNDGTPDVTLDGQFNGRVLDITSGTVELDGLTIQRGLVSGNGGGFGSTTGGDGLGAGVRVTGAGTQVTMLHSVLTNNLASGGGGGGSGNGSYNYGGGGGGGTSGKGGGNGGDYNGSTSGGTGSSGNGGIGGHNGTSAQSGKGGTNAGSGGAGGSVAGGFVAGGNGASASSGGTSIGGGGGGAGASGGSTGGRGGHAAGGLFIGSGSTAYLASTTVSNNLGAGGGGGGGYTTAGGAGGDGAGGARIVGTLKYDNTSMVFSNNGGAGGSGGGSNGTGGANGNSTNNLRSAGGTIDPNWTPPATPPAITSATYDASTAVLVVTGSDFQANGGGADVDASDLTLTAEGGATHTLTDTSDVEIDSATQFTLTLSTADKAAVNQIVNKNGTSSTGGTTYNLAGAVGFVTASASDSDLTGNGITASNVAVPTITSATYDANSGVLTVTGTGLLKASGATNDITANKFTFTGEGGSTYTLTDTADVEITSGTAFALTLSATDKAAVNQILNKNGTSSTGATTYNLAAAEDWAAGAAAAVVVADLTGNGITTSNVAVPTITSATYDANSGALVVTGTGFLKLSGATNDIVANKFTFTGEGGGTYTLTDTANVESTSGTSFTLTLSATDKAAVNLLLNKNGTSSTSATTYNLAAAEDWAAGADGAVTVVDATGNGVTVSNVAVPAITSATYDGSTGALVVTGTGFLPLNGATNDIVANKFTFTGQGGATYTLTDTSNVEITSGTSFTLTLSVTDRAAVNQILNKNGTSSLGGTTYNLAAAEDWAAGADPAVAVADTTGNGITVSNHVNLAPDVSGLPASRSFTEDTQADFDISASAFSDADSASITVALSASAGTFGLAASGSVTLGGNGTSTISIAGTPANVNQYLDTPSNTTYTPASNENGSPAATVTVTANDGDGSGNVSLGTIDLNVTAVNDAPTATNLTQSKTAIEGGSATTLDDIVVTDVDSGDTITATLTLSDTGAGTLSTGTYGSATSTYNAGTGVWTVTGSEADVNAALAAVALTPSANNDQNFTITTRIRDAADTGPADGTISVTVTPMNDAPTLTATGLNPTFAEGGPAVDLFGTISASTVDSGQTFAALTLTVTNVSDAANEILAIGGTDVALTNGNSGTLTGIGSFSVSVAAGTATVSVTGLTRDNTQMATLVDGITYENAAVPPGSTARVVTLTGIQDSGGTASGGVDSTTLSIASTVAIDLAPTVSGQSVPADATYKVNQNLDFTVTYTENVSVNTGGGTPYIAVTLDTGGSVQAAYNGGTGTTTLTFRYTVALGNLDTDGIAVASSITLNGGTIKDGAGTNAQVTSLGFGSTASVLVDAVAPTVSSINRQTPSGASTNATSVVYRATFSESVTGVGIADFTLTSTGTASGNIDSVSANSGSSIDVTVIDVAGDGTLRLDLNAFGTGITDAATNGISGGYTSGQTYTIDNTVPNAPSTPDLTSGTDSGSSNSDDITNDPTPTFTGTAEADSTVTLYDTDGTTVLGTATATGGNWSITSSALADGSHTITAKSSDSSGNTSSASSALSVTIDTAAPAVPVISAITDDTGASSTDEITTDTTLVLSGTSEADATIIVFRNAAQVGTATADGSGAWNFDYTSTTLAEGAHSFTATATDVAGNASNDSTVLLVEVDATTPGAPVITGITNDTGASNTDGITNDATLAFAGTSDANLVITVSRSGMGVVGTTTADGSGAWTFDYTATTLAGGDHVFTAFATDTAGNASAVSADFPVTVDATAPSAPASFAAAAEGSTITLTWTNPASDFVSSTIRRSTTAFPASVSDGTAVASGQTGTSLNDTGLADGIYYYSIFALDALGNVSAAANATATVDTTAPVITSAGSASGTYDASFSFTVTASGDAVSYGATGLPGGISINSSTGAIAGTPAAAGSFNATVTATDAVGNIGSATLAITIAKADQTVTFPSIGPVTVGSSVSLSATASSGLPVTFSVVSGNATVSGASFTANDSNEITLRSTQSGNANYNAASAEQTIASNSITKLTQTITFAPPTDHVTTDAAFALSATASSGLTVSFVVQSGPATVSGGTLTLTGAPGTVTVVASQAGNAAYTAAASVTRSFAVTAPGELIYFGTLTNGTQNVGTLAGHLNPEGSHGVLIGYLPGESGGFIVDFTPDEHGAFVIPITPILLTSVPAGQGGPAIAAAQSTWTFQGQLSGETITGTITELALSFGVVADPVTGPTAPMAGYYTSSSLDTSTGALYSIVGTEGDVFTLATLSDLVAAGTGTVNAATGDFVADLGDGITLDGNVDAPSTVVDGAIIRPTGDSTDFSGVRSDTARTDRLINLSSRARVGTGENVVITGFVVSGPAPKPVLLRAVGPGLSRFNLPGVLADPRMTLVQNGAVLATNDDWGAAANASDITAAMQQTGAFELSTDSKDAAILLTLQPGIYTAIIDGVTGGGVALAEVYDASASPADEYQRLLNISTRGYVGPGADTLIGGFVVTGNAPKRILVRGVGPTLGSLGVGNPLGDPTLTIFQGATAIAQNTDWGAGANSAADLASAATATGAFALGSGSADAAIVITLAPGAYTAHVTSATTATGIALVEIYELPGQ